MENDTGRREKGEEEEKTPEQQLIEVRQQLSDLRRVVRSYDLVTNCLPPWLKVIIVMAHPVAYNGATAEEMREKLKREITGTSYVRKDRARRICEGLIKKGFAPTCVLGIGSFTYQYNTRDTFGFAMKATAGMVDGEMREIFKNPKTDDGTKKSAKGLLAVYYGPDDVPYLKQQATWEEVKNCAFIQVFKDGKATRLQSLGEIRARLKSQRSW